MIYFHKQSLARYVERRPCGGRDAATEPTGMYLRRVAVHITGMGLL